VSATKRHLTPGSFLVLFVGGGFTVAVQSRANGELTHHVGNGVLAATWSFGTGFLIACAFLLSPAVRAGLRNVRQALRDRTLIWWAVPAGMLGSIFVASQSVTVALIGVAMFSVGIVAGQTINSLVVDHYGLSPIGRQHITGRRLLSAGITIAAVLIAVGNRLTAGDSRYWAVLLAVIAGAGVAVQQALTGRVSVAARQPISAMWINFVFGAALLVVMSLVGIAFCGVQLRAPTAGPWWMYIGGVLGVTFIITASWAVPRYGVLVFALCSIAGQLALGLVLDIVLPLPGTTVGWNLVVGVALTLVAVAISSLRGRAPSN